MPYTGATAAAAHGTSAAASRVSTHAVGHEDVVVDEERVLGVEVAQGEVPGLVRREVMVCP